MSICPLDIILSVLRFTASDFQFGIFKLFLNVKLFESIKPETIKLSQTKYTYIPVVDILFVRTKFAGIYVGVGLFRAMIVT